MYKMVIVSIMTFSLWVGHDTVQASSKWDRENVDPYHEWTITFNKELNPDALSYFYVGDQDGYSVGVETILSPDQKTVTILPPKGGYTPGNSYILYIERNVSTKSYERLKVGTVVNFQVENTLLPLGLTYMEHELATLINEYRESLGLKALPVSKSLTEVARAHVQNSSLYSPEKGQDHRGISCNLHSWSANGNWSPVCYTSDHQYAQNMWDKPRELTSYRGNGYEISMGGGSNLTATRALQA